MSDAAAAGRWLAGVGLAPQEALVSAAERTRSTWHHLAQAASWDLEPVFERALYAAGPESALDLVRTTDAGVSTLIVVGHNPTIATLAHLLDNGEGDSGVAGEMSMDFPTCALAVFEFDGAWADLDWASARITGYHVGRG
jgi:phosphohistidine phosphatase